MAAPGFAIEGRRVTLPVEVRDARCAFASFLVPADRVRALVPAGVDVAEAFPGRAIASLAGIEYRDNDLGAYNELAVAFLARTGGGRALPLAGMALDLARGRLAAYIHRLPVTTAFSCAAGRDIWGFPKTVDDVRFADADGRRTSTWSIDGVRVLTLAVARGGRLRYGDLRLDALGAVGGLRRTPFTSSGEGVGFRLGGATLTLGSHPLAAELATLGLPRRALMSGWIERMRARFEAPVPA